MTPFESAFGAQPAVTVFTPGRVNLIGEHTDYNGGMVLPTALARGVRVALRLRDDDRVRTVSDRYDAAAEAALDGPLPSDWSDYVVGALRIARAAGLTVGGADVALASDLPDGAGLSSSAAVCVGVLRAVAATGDADLSPVTAARLAQRVENEVLGVPCGIMDQMAVAIAQPGEALALDTRDLSHETIPLPDTHRFVILHSGVRRALNEGRYAERRAECEAAAAALGVPHLCRMSTDEAERAACLPEPLAARSRHCRTEHARTVAAAAALRARDMPRFGELMTRSHASLRDDFAVSVPAVDALVETALTAGALGARMTGGGFGGCIVACVAAADADDWAEAVLARHPVARRVA